MLIPDVHLQRYQSDIKLSTTEGHRPLETTLSSRKDRGGSGSNSVGLQLWLNQQRSSICTDGRVALQQRRRDRVQFTMMSSCLAANTFLLPAITLKLTSGVSPFPRDLRPDQSHNCS